MKNDFEIVVLCGGISSESEVSLRSGKQVASLLEKHLPVRLIALEKNALPEDLDPKRCVIFPMTHGEFGEDGQLQHLLEARGFYFVGADSRSAALGMNKTQTKIVAAKAGIPVLRQMTFSTAEKNQFTFATVCKTLKTDSLFLKPNDRGSSIHCFPIADGEQWRECMAQLPQDQWIIEPHIEGRDMTQGILHGEPLAIVEVVSTENFLTYNDKYSAHGAKHRCPAPISQELSDRISDYSHRIFKACDGRDWARTDYILAADGRVFFLEINMIPGFTATSFYPDSGKNKGLPPEILCRQILQPTLNRFLQDRS